MDQHAVSGVALAAMARDGVPVIDMRMFTDIERNLAAGIHTNFKIAGVIDLLNCAQLPVGNMQVSRWSRELYPITLRKRTIHLLVHRYTRESAWIIVLLSAIISLCGY